MNEEFIDSLVEKLKNLNIDKKSEKVNVLTEYQSFYDFENSLKELEGDGEVNKVTLGKNPTQTYTTKAYYKRPLPVGMQFEENNHMFLVSQYDGKIVVE